MSEGTSNYFFVIISAVQSRPFIDQLARFADISSIRVNGWRAAFISSGDKRISGVLSRMQV